MYADKEELLTKAKTLMQSEVTSISYNTWIKNLEISSIDNNKITLIAQSKLQKDAIESRSLELFINTFNYITNTSCEVSVIEKCCQIIIDTMLAYGLECEIEMVDDIRYITVDGKTKKLSLIPAMFRDRTSVKKDTVVIQDRICIEAPSLIYYKIMSQLN